MNIHNSITRLTNKKGNEIHTKVIKGSLMSYCREVAKDFLK